MQCSSSKNTTISGTKSTNTFYYVEIDGKSICRTIGTARYQSGYQETVRSSDADLLFKKLPGAETMGQQVRNS